jgi:hypothetical protein
MPELQRELDFWVIKFWSSLQLWFNKIGKEENFEPLIYTAQKNSVIFYCGYRALN